MNKYKVTVDFVFTSEMMIEAKDETTAKAMVMAADHDQIAHLNGKSYADVQDAERFITSVEVIE